MLPRAATLVRVFLLGLVALVGLEVALRLAKYEAPLLYRPDTTLGWTFRPSVAGVNRAGFRDSERVVDKPEGVFRIAVLGDSYTAALEVDVQQTYWRLLPSRLRQCGLAAGKDIETLAFAAAGYSTGQEAILLETTVMRYQPDLVLLQFSRVQDNSIFLADEKARPFFLLDPKGVLRLDDGFVDRAAFQAHASFSHELARKLADRSRSVQLAFKVRNMPFFGEAQARNGHQPLALVQPRDERWEDAWRITEALLVRMHHYSARNGARFAVFTAPHPVQLGNDDLLYPDRRIEAYAKRRGISAFSLGEAMKGRQDLYAGRHWNAAGHAAVADLLAERLCAK